jgi:peptidoglycan/LPS O-acetylase OafA/YrhL
MSIGEVSYSLYLMHGIVLYFMKKIPVFYLKESWLSCLLFCTVFFVVSFSLSKLTYLYIEKPFMKFKFRKPSLPFTPPPAAGM